MPACRRDLAPGGGPGPAGQARPGRLVLGIETSCDETAAAIVAGGTELLSSVVASQADLHGRWGGVVPELASRRHVETIVPVVREALDQAGLDWPDLGGIAVTNGPGLIGSLLVGVSYAKAVALARDLPLVGVNHVAGHLYAAFLGGRPPDFPFLALTVSGGHTDLAVYHDHGPGRPVGATRDDAAGEAFDKVARLLGLGYPGGPAVDRLAADGNPGALSWPSPRLAPDQGGRFDFSFSGLKTAVRYYLDRMDASGQAVSRADVAASFQAAVASALAGAAVEAARAYRVPRVVVAGGVAANRALRAELERRAAEHGLGLCIPPPSLCTDNAAMIASMGYFRLQRGCRDGLDLPVFSHQEPAGPAPSAGAGQSCHPG